MPSEQDLRSIYIDDFRAGYMPDVEAENIPLNGSPDCKNVFAPRAGELWQRYGMDEILDSLLSTGVIDGHRAFLDAGGNQHQAVWVNGNLYEWITGSSTEIAAGVYQAGQRIAHVVREGILIFSDGITFHAPDNVGAYYWDPSNGATPTGPMDYEPSTGLVPFPAFKAAGLFNGSIVLGGVHAYGYDPAPHSLMWTDPQFTHWVYASNVFPVDKGFGGSINSIVPLTLVSDAETPLDSFFVGKTGAVYLAQGPLTAADLKVPKINCTDGVLDPETVRFVDYDGGSVIFLGTNKRVWATRGLEAKEISDNFRTELYDYITTRLQADPAQRFTSCRIFSDYHYMLDVGGNRQYVMDWRTGAWFKYEGWTSGLWSEGEDPYKIKPLYCVYVSGGTARMAHANTGYTDNGTVIDAYWTTPDLRGAVGDDYGNAGDKSVKRWYDTFIEGFVHQTSTLVGTFTADRGLGQTGTDSVSITGVAQSGSRYDSGYEYDAADAIYGTITAPTKTKFRKRLEMFKTNTATGGNSRLHGLTMAVKIAQTVAGGYFGLYNIEVLFMPRKGGRGRAETI